jgi:hypothetical protein
MSGGSSGGRNPNKHRKASGLQSFEFDARIAESFFRFAVAAVSRHLRAVSFEHLGQAFNITTGRRIARDRCANGSDDPALDWSCHARRDGIAKAQHGHFAGLDISVKKISVCLLDDAGRIVREVKVASELEALLAALRSPACDTKSAADSFAVILDLKK